MAKMSSAPRISNRSPQTLQPTYLTTPALRGCGPRCANVCAYENNGTAGFYYTCEVIVSNVTNATLETLRVSDANAKIAAGAISLQGYQANGDSSQQQQFPLQSTYGKFLHGNGSVMAAHMRRFAIGVFVTADQIVSFVDEPVPGYLPDEGVRLSIDHHKGMWAIFGTLGGTHLVLFIFGVYFAHKVIVVEDNYTAIALLLRPLADELAGKGGLLDREKRDKLVEHLEVVYGPRTREKGSARALEISEYADCETGPKRWEGYYDS
jgi:hypothetical protein